MNDDDNRPCTFCGATKQVIWSQVLSYACASCRQQRTYDMLAQPVTPLPVRDGT